MKKFLSLVMTLAMAVSLFAFAVPSAGAKDFTDSESITNRAMVEAADVISAIEVMDGYSDNSFKPQNPLTRQAAAKIICNMILGPTTAKALPTNQNPFPDVAAGTEFAGYIAYCADNGIISGYADGTFRGGDPLSGYAFLKMLLGALRYDSATEGYTGANWRVNVAKRALGIGLDRGLGTELDGSRVVTREEAALYACNTLKADLVEYDNNNTTIIINGNDVSTGNGNKGTAKAVSWENSRSYSGNIAPETTFRERDNYVQFAEQYFNRLIMRVTQEDDFGRPARRWTWKGVEVGVYPETADKTYYGDINFNDIYKDLNMSGEDTRGLVFVNGVPLDPNNITTPANAGGIQRGIVDIKRSNDKSLNDYDKEMTDRTTTKGQDYRDALDNWGTLSTMTAAQGLAQQNEHLDAFHANGRIGDGTIVEVYRNDDINAVTICVISVYPGQVTNVNAAKSTKDAYVVVEGYDRNNLGLTVPEGAKNVFQSDGRNEFETTAFAEDDIVWFTYSDNTRGIVSMEKMTSAEGSVTRRVVNKSVTLAGTTYNYGKNYAFDTNLSQDDLYNDETFIVHMDSQGYALWIESAEFSSNNYALLTRITSEFTDEQDRVHTLTGLEPIYNAVNQATDTWNGNRAHLVFADGTERNVDLDDDYIVEQGTGANKVIRINSNFSLNQTLKIVRYRVLNDGTYRLYSVNNQLAQFRTAFANDPDTDYTEPTQSASEVRYINPTNASSTPSAFRIADKAATVTQITKRTSNNVTTYTPSSAITDSKTIFVVKDGNSYKVYTGVRNAPTVTGNNAAAYCYYTGEGNNRVAKLVYVTNGTIQNNSKDITFIAAKSASGVITSNDTDNFREFNAVVKGEITTLMLDTNLNLETSVSSMGVNTASDDYTQLNNVILNNTNYDNDDIMNSGRFSSNTLELRRTFGIKKVSGSTNLIELGGAEYEVANDALMFFVNDDGDISRISTVANYVNDGDDVSFFTYDREDGVITNLYVCEYEIDADPTGGRPMLAALTFDVDYGNGNIIQDVAIETITAINQPTYPAHIADNDKYGDFDPNDVNRIDYWVYLPGNTPNGTRFTLKPVAANGSEVTMAESALSFTTTPNTGDYNAFVKVARTDGLNNDTRTYSVHFSKMDNDDTNLASLTLTNAKIETQNLSMADAGDVTYVAVGQSRVVFNDVALQTNANGIDPVAGESITLNVDPQVPSATVTGSTTITLVTDPNGGLMGTTTFTVTSHTEVDNNYGGKTPYTRSTEYTVNVHT